MQLLGGDLNFTEDPTTFIHFAERFGEHTIDLTQFIRVPEYSIAPLWGLRYMKLND